MDTTCGRCDQKDLDYMEEDCPNKMLKLPRVILPFQKLAIYAKERWQS